MTKQLQNKRTWANLFPSEKKAWQKYCGKRKEATVLRELILKALSPSGD